MQPKEKSISIHALREEGDTDTPEQLARYKEISIHALREEGDTWHDVFDCANGISIHALREEGDWVLVRVYNGDL